jgi:predicted phosphodiesterase
VRYLILSDIHSNADGLRAVLDHARGKYDQILCCGDLVGYGAEPNEVVDWTRANVAAVVRGNHDKACAELENLEWFNAVARAATFWTQQQLTPRNLAYLRALPMGPMAVESFQILHGSPLDEDEYLASLFDIRQVSPFLTKQVTFFGHTHLPGAFLCHRNGVRKLRKTIVELEPDGWYMFNPGSVGQPRDGDPRAGYLIYSPEDRVITFYRVPYDVESAQNKIRQAGLPELLAERLARGA